MVGKICLRAIGSVRFEVKTTPVLTNLHSQPVIRQNVFVELTKGATFSVEFCFYNTMYKQTDGVAMGSPLGSVWLKFFLGYYEEK